MKIHIPLPYNEHKQLCARKNKMKHSIVELQKDYTKYDKIHVYLIIEMCCMAGKNRDPIL